MDGPLAVGVTGRHRVVCFNQVSIVFSFCFLLNLAAMPLKAYLSEAFPWSHRPTPTVGVQVRSNETFEMYEAHALAFYRSRYNNNSLDLTTQYAFDPAQVLDVIWVPIAFVQPEDFSFAGLPGATFYSRRARRTVKGFLTGPTNASTFAVIEVGTLLGQPSSVSGVWVEILPPTNAMLLYFAAQLSPGSTHWLYFKFAYRIGLTSVILERMWSTYYRHYRTLVSNLRALGVPNITDATWIEIVVGDPTALILQNSLVCGLFVVDFWCSIEIVGQSFVRLSQLQNLVTFSLAALYLSRTVWFAYLLLNLTGRALRRYHLERLIAQVDPTTVAVAVLFSVGPVTYMQSRTGFFVDIYHFLFTFIVPKDRIDNYKEDFLAAMLYSILIGLLPISYGFGKPIALALHRRAHRTLRRQARSIRVRPTQPNVARRLTHHADDFGKYVYNDWKHRCLYTILTALNPQHASALFLGGSIYKIFDTHRGFQRNAAFSFRGSDCYVIAHAPTSVLSYRLSLVDCLHLHHPHLRTQDTYKRAFGHIELAPETASLVVTLGRGKVHWVQ
ncbi:hypothetical protein SPRG_08105 [Saprolegnia parasitica CBS 223.65]|uniref:Uncharacterized protein n=1 Tax=Saprolegnia parasitica (strain CBS 223.65) TaxID=695850 RepID=A0A067CCB8_SAPPC|nr:hypothetical protein SPRG_08105 [Saprolegnia parasitica CBS 223.65]KDO26815.1 hypothetical protein SPRG_08105 [Saprolegnia parasitica CBS 223.65]|eukprot:XP_012202463.1 hypothetical protein SPRG_08105 [Saprolegnia parasitica CBS 223.65]